MLTLTNGVLIRRKGTSIKTELHLWKMVLVLHALLFLPAYGAENELVFENRKNKGVLLSKYRSSFTYDGVMSR